MTAPASGPRRHSIRVSPAALRVVLFGMPDAGKTSLLGALSRAAHTQERLLQGKLVGSEGLAALEQQLYERRSRETLEEIVPYPVTLQSVTGEKCEAVLYDCDGRIANELLSQRKTLEAESRKSALAQAVLTADALILVVDASAPAEQMDNDFREFVQFVRHLNHYRSEQHEVGGLPVYLVLSKCDLLVPAGATPEQWEARIAERTAQVEERFRFFLGDEGEDRDAAGGFGSIDLQIEHTAVQKPALGDTPEPTREPVGVAELFAGVFAAAGAYRARIALARRRLAWTLGVAAAFLVVVLGVGLTLVLTRGSELSLALGNKLEGYRAREGLTVNARLAPNLLRDRLRELTELSEDREFPQLSEESRQFITDRKAEIEAYIQYREQLEAFYPLSKLTGFAQLTQAETALREKLLIPEPYRATWGASEAVELRNRLLAEIPKIQAGFRELERHYDELRNRGRQLLTVSELNSKWEGQVKSLLEKDGKLPFPESDPARGRAYQLTEIEQLQAEWTRVREPLIQLRNLGLATGLLGDTSGVQPTLALLDLPEQADVNRVCLERLQALRQLYPESRNWNLARFSDSIRPQLEVRIKTLVDLTLRLGQKMILQQFRRLNPAGETAGDWLKISDWLLSNDLAAYREFLLFLHRLLDPAAVDPVNQMVDFLRRSSFTLELREWQLSLPEGLDGFKGTPVEPLEVFTIPAGESATQAIRYQLLGEPRRDRDGRWVYTFVLREGEPRINYRPGTTTWATVKLRDGAKSMQLTWSRNHSAMYQFDRFVRTPTLHEPNKPVSAGTVAEGVQLSLSRGTLPAVPALLPLVP